MRIFKLQSQYLFSWEEYHPKIDLILNEDWRVSCNKSSIMRFTCLLNYTGNKEWLLSRTA